MIKITLYRYITIILFAIFTISCNEIKDGEAYFSITEKDLIPEGITYSSTTNSFYLSSVYKTKIIQVDAETGSFKDFISSESIDLRFLGMIVDDERKQLWACGNITREARFSAIVKLDLLTGKLIKRYELNDTSKVFFNDLALDKQGNIYITNTEGQSVYKINSEYDSISIFYDGEEIDEPNGIAISPDNSVLYIASTSRGIHVLDIANRSIIGEPDTSLKSFGVDGLKYFNNNLIAIQNEVNTYEEINISSFELDKTGTRIISRDIIDSNNPLFNDVPTTLVIKDNQAFCINSQLNKLTYPEYEIRDPDKLNNVTIVKYNLEIY